MPKAQGTHAGQGPACGPALTHGRVLHVLVLQLFASSKFLCCQEVGAEQVEEWEWTSLRMKASLGLLSLPVVTIAA